MNYISSTMSCDMPWTDEAERRYASVCETKDQYQQLIDMYDSFDSYSASQLQVITLNDSSRNNLTNRNK